MNSAPRFHTAGGENVTERINNGKTISFTDMKEAEEYAKQKRSYTYFLYKDDSFYGYGVPK